jgi:hypothetical protein
MDKYLQSQWHVTTTPQSLIDAAPLMYRALRALFDELPSYYSDRMDDSIWMMAEHALNVAEGK